jgi:Zn-dependent protease/predicted transcriptional regulator
MKGSLKLITLKGISVYLHFTFLIFVVWMLFLYIASGMHWQHLLWALIFLLSIFGCVVLHEYGHAFVASWFGINAKKITIYPIGGIASIEKLPENPKQELLISAAGPFVSFVLASLLILFSPQSFSWQDIKQYGGVINQDNFLYMLGWVNIALAVFNLIPAFPMDGGRILRALLAFRFNYIKATVIAASIGKFIAVFIILVALLTMNFILALTGVFIVLFAGAEESYLRIRTLVKDIRLSEVLMYDYKSIDAGLTVNEAANILANQHNKYFIVMDNGLPVGTLNRLEVMKAVSEQQYERNISELMKENIEYFDGNMLVSEVIDKLSGNEERIYPVFDKERFLGVVSFEHIIEYLLIHKAASKDYIKTKSLAELV